MLDGNPEGNVVIDIMHLPDGQVAVETRRTSTGTEEPQVHPGQIQRREFMAAIFGPPSRMRNLAYQEALDEDIRRRPYKE